MLDIRKWLATMSLTRCCTYLPFFFLVVFAFFFVFFHISPLSLLMCQQSVTLSFSLSLKSRIQSVLYLQCFSCMASSHRDLAWSPRCLRLPGLIFHALRVSRCFFSSISLSQVVMMKISVPQYTQYIVLVLGWGLPIVPVVVMGAEGVLGSDFTPGESD